MSLQDASIEETKANAVSTAKVSQTLQTNLTVCVCNVTTQKAPHFSNI